MALPFLKMIGTALKGVGKKILGWVAPGLSGLLQGAAANKVLNNELTGKEREQNAFNAQQAEVQRQFAHDERVASQEFNASQAEAQMAFQERMSNTQYQRQVADMQAAGVNPAMAMSGITGASAAGAMAQSSPASGSAASGSGQLQGLSDLLQFARIRKEMELLDAQKRETYSRADKNDADALYTARQTAWVDKRSQADLDEIASRIGVNTSTVNSREYENALKVAQTAQVVKNTEWLDRINSAKTEADKARAAYDYAEAAISKLEKELGHRLGNSEMLAIADAISSFLGFGLGDGISGVTDKVGEHIAGVDWLDALSGPIGAAVIRAIKKHLED